MKYKLSKEEIESQIVSHKQAVNHHLATIEHELGFLETVAKRKAQETTSKAARQTAKAGAFVIGSWMAWKVMRGASNTLGSFSSAAAGHNHAGSLFHVRHKAPKHMLFDQKNFTDKLIADSKHMMVEGQQWLNRVNPYHTPRRRFPKGIALGVGASVAIAAGVVYAAQKLTDADVRAAVSKKASALREQAGELFKQAKASFDSSTARPSSAQPVAESKPVAAPPPVQQPTFPKPPPSPIVTQDPFVDQPLSSIPIVEVDSILPPPVAEPQGDGAAPRESTVALEAEVRTPRGGLRAGDRSTGSWPSKRSGTESWS